MADGTRRFFARRVLSRTAMASALAPERRCSFGRVLPRRPAAPKPAKAAPGQAGQARKQRPVLLQKQERIQSPENGSIARFDGLGRYQSRSKKAGAFFYCRAVRTLAGAACGWLARQGLMSSPPRRV